MRRLWRCGFAEVQQCLDPLPDAVLIDTHHNQLMRQARRLPWRKADAVTSLTIAEMAYLHAKRIHAMYALEDEDKSGSYSDQRTISVDRKRQAVADQIRVPAPDLLAVQWKREAAKDRYLPIGADEVAKLIAADEAVLAAHPITKQPRRKRGRSDHH
ncbi:hypothetical protein [Mesorhizobium sp.]|uniref:hypothetical protein n=1 Tax=Mesorhizobium sp. TaxID=1871066 RepID=UPI000FE31EFD|nr:hypothetical protein [Mesorhizobium sp.]RWN51941.1 MAG: hypothetical protein EOR98_24130 [Mesorhizobium sp.]RWN52185.1 MAG: hypothetical protein EOS00_33300 [Mesorhizobium sp.]RWN73050.1 MAG: hypothetical protein EOS02_25470 [Mesorhizobium sp.]RWN76232.1 MAG: hypothetical protein EOS01_21185 [Mesorhizobium sp.]RWN85978.1 MAG: hypothetical protein EOS04_20580 [Mesorhizobium sp.]